MNQLRSDTVEDFCKERLLYTLMIIIISILPCCSQVIGSDRDWSLHRNGNYQLQVQLTYEEDVKASGNEAERKLLGIKESQTPSNGMNGSDVRRTATAFRHEVMDNLTPTMRMFSLQGKVAMVTG